MGVTPARYRRGRTRRSPEFQGIRSGERAIFVFAFAKSDKANLSAAELKVYRKAASIMLELGVEQIETEVEAGRLIEVNNDEQG